ncbi:MAG: peptide deformylase [Streptosporangiaceae bacterium]|nr:peptide deformylase [Streptosporangiaceae bacterium]
MANSWRKPEVSFFDVRGMVPRPLIVHVEHQTIDGQRHITIFEKGLARLVAHEVDHLNGTLYTERIRPSAALIPVSEYGGTGERWRYSDQRS